MKRLSLLLSLVLVLMFSACAKTSPEVATDIERNDHVVELPAPDKITPRNVRAYLNRDDSLYIDIRNYEEYVQGHIRNFELIPFSALIYAYQAETEPNSVQLYGGFPEAPIPVFNESDEVLEKLFPKDKNLFIICRSGNRSAAMVHLLMERGWDKEKLYDIGGILDYERNPEYQDLLVSWPMYRSITNYAVQGLTRIER